MDFKLLHNLYPALMSKHIIWMIKKNATSWENGNVKEALIKGQKYGNIFR